MMFALFKKIVEKRIHSFLSSYLCVCNLLAFYTTPNKPLLQYARLVRIPGESTRKTLFLMDKSLKGAFEINEFIISDNFFILFHLPYSLKYFQTNYFSPFSEKMAPSSSYLKKNWSHEDKITLISLARNYDVLWNTAYPFYRELTQRKRALEEIKDLMENKYCGTLKMLKCNLKN